MRPRSVFVGVAVVLTLLVGGCSSSDKAATSDPASSSSTSGKSSAGTPKGPKNPCDLVSKKDAEAAFGGTKLELLEGFRKDACDYTGADPSVMLSLTVEYDARGLNGLELEDLVGVLADEDADVTAVNGLGDSAFAFKVISGDTLMVSIGEGLLTISMVGGPDDSVPAMTTLAKAALKKL